MGDLWQPDRLLRKRNSSLQKQLDVTLQILGQEYRQCKERMYKEERDCGKFLQTLYDTVPDLQNYGQPNTRAMNTSGALRERRYATPDSLHANGSPHPHPDDPNHNPRDSSNKQQQQTEGKRKPRWNMDHALRASNTDPSEKKKNEATKDVTSKVLGSGNPATGIFRREGQGEKGGKSANRPHTAGPHRTQGFAESHHRSHRSSSFGSHKPPAPSFGKGAYSEYEQCIHDLVLKRFHVIFNPDTSKHKVSTTATPVAVPQTPRGDSNHTTEAQKTVNINGSDNRKQEPSGGHRHKVSEANGDESSEHKKQGERRVVWSSRPCRKLGSVSARNMDDVEAPGSKNCSDDRPKPRSNSVSLHNSRPKSGLPNGHAPLQHSHVDAKIRALALRRNFAFCDDSSDDSDESRLHTESSGDTMSRVGNTQQNPAACEVQNHYKPGSSKASFIHTHSHHNPRSATPIYNQTHSHKTPNDHRTNTPPRTPSPTQAMKRKHGTMHRPTSRMSSTSDGMSADQLVDKLMNAGRTPGSQQRRPMTAPSMSELSHRLIPVPRQTVMGILSEIENQKASTRNLLTTSKELQQIVKNLVPWEQRPDDDSD